MSEFVGTRCDTCGKLTDVEPIDVVDELEWEENDIGSHFCVECQEVAKDLEANAASAEELAAFGVVVGEEADAVLESPEVVKAKEDRLAAFTQIKADTFKSIRAAMAKEGFTEDAISEALEETEKELDETYNNKFNFKLEA